MSYLFTADEIRAAEKPLLDAQGFPDQLMQSAAHAVFEVAQAMLEWPEHWVSEHVDDRNRVLILAGSGGNGGDALYAGAELARAGHPVDVWLTSGESHHGSLLQNRLGGQTLLQNPTADTIDPRHYKLAIDGITGIGGRGGLSEEVGEVLKALKAWYVDILSVDVPSGVNADTGEAYDIHVEADVTVTFGGWRRAHALAPECGIQLLSDIEIPGHKLSDELHSNLGKGELAYLGSRAIVPDHAWPDGISPLSHENVNHYEPGPHDDKYTGGVVGIRAGSGKYPGAAILATAGAVNATPAMVRYVGPQALEVVRAHPEVVVTETLADAGQVQAWVFGPGAGTDRTDELAELLARDTPLLIDADGITLIAESAELQKQLTRREAITVLTPHDGEFVRLREALGLAPGDRLAETEAMAQHLGCAVLRKGRATIIVEQPCDDVQTHVHIVDAGNSWAATPGSGDVLAGLMGAFMARAGAEFPKASQYSLSQAVTVHARAAHLSAQTEFGAGVSSASKIADAVPSAIAQLAYRRF
ncbi:NAD(P)H-hydrate dehydratase [Corynebacterium breve]|uniref:ADP-dependent (S)-NAD(P)H-hydrate dehydratase n=1 Tax=Corynebacterium breve TaxID=3049799 RepID=A0ABY8VD55_9CORY|nr:bifunctional ADP-dependent NAD(P)H-hydrate dehydratase/NAD(P)H-hydrate epimerase [Corynebacterium breve]WIM67601.1 NAD(P)H-hydrate dehydratase [Corynebacterium breve]